MRLKTYRAGSVVQAMGLIRAELGADALILSTRRVAQGVEITACLEPADDDLPPPTPLANGPALANTADAGALGNGLSQPPAPDRDARPLQPWVPGGYAGTHAPSHHPPHDQSLSQADTAAGNSLLWHGIPAAIAARLAGPNLVRALGDLLQFGTLPLGGHAPLLLAGSPGAGKTLTAARLATRLVMAGHMPLVISADGRRAAAADELAAYTRLLGIELMVASKASTVGRALQRRPPGAPVLIDSAGLNPFDPAHIRALCDLAAAAEALPILVLAAGQDAAEAAEQAEIFADAGIRHLIPTRLDLARRLGSPVAAAYTGGMILSEAGTGPGATDGLTQMTPSVLADRLSRMPARMPGRQTSAPPLSDRRHVQ